MKFINARKFNEINDWIDDDTLEELRDFESGEDNNFEVYDADANEEPMQIYEIEDGDEAARSYLADNYVPIGESLNVSPTNPMEDSLREVDEFRRREEIPEEEVLEEEPLIRKRDEEDEVDESVAEETEIDERVPDFKTTEDAINAAIEEHRVMEIFYVTKGRGSRDEKYYLKRERGLPRENSGGVNIHRIVEPHYMYTPMKGKNPEDNKKIVVTYDRSVRRIRSFVIDNIYKYNFTKNRKTKEDQYFKPRIKRIKPPSGKGIKTMKNTNDKLVKIASTLEEKGLKKSSSIVRDAALALSNFKMAQYVGVQGYWLKNRRCWDNCYRHKRTTQPNTAAQEVWMECWDEYKDSINNSKSTWAKYASVKKAGDDDWDINDPKERERRCPACGKVTNNGDCLNGKCPSKDHNYRLTSVDEKNWNKIFAGKVDKKVSEGLTRPEAIYATIEAESQAYVSKIIEASSDLMTLADTLIESGNEDLGKQMAEMSIEILKEAEIGGQQQNFIGRGVDKVKGFFGGMKGQGNKADVIKKIQNTIERANQLLALLNRSNMPQKAQASSQGFIIEAGKGMRMVEAVLGPHVGKEQTQPGYEKPLKSQQDILNDPNRERPKKTQNPVEIGQGDKDQDGEPDTTDKDDTPPDNQVDTPQAEDAPQGDPTQTDADQDGKSDAEEAQSDTDHDGVTDDKDVDADGDNVEDSKEQGQEQPSLNESYLSLVNDVGALAKEFTGLQAAKDQEVAQYAKGATPLLQNFINNSSALRKLPPGTEQRQSLRGTLEQLATNLQGVLANPGQALQQATQMGNQQLGNQQMSNQTGAIPGTEQVSQAMPNLVATVSKNPQAAQLSQMLQRGKATQPTITWLMGQFEGNGVPFTVSNLQQFTTELSSAFAQKAAMPKAGFVITKKENKK